MAVSCSCPEQWWRAPVYTSVSILLAFIAISSAIQATHRSSTVPSLLDQQLSLNASSALRSSGFTAMAALLRIFLYPNSTVFAFRDAAFSDTSRPPRLLKDLLRYHVSPLVLSMGDLLKMPEGSCLPTLLPGKSVVITRVNASARILEINNVVVSNPDLFLSDTLAIHGVLRPLSSLRFPPPSCYSDEMAKKKSGSPKRTPAIPSAYLVFMEDFRKTYKEKFPDNKLVSAVAKAGGEKWKSMSDSEKAPYQEKAMKRKAEYGKALEAFKNNQAVVEDAGSEKTSSQVHDNAGHQASS